MCKHELECVNKGKKWWFFILSITFCLSTIFFGCSKKSGKILAQSDGEKITTDDFENTIENAPPALQDYLTTEAGRRQYLDAMVKEKVVLVAAKSQGIQNRAAVKKQLAEIEKRLKDNYEKLKNEIIMDELLKEKVALNDTEIKDYYDKHKSEFENPTQIRVSHILLVTEQDAGKVLDMLRKGGDFAALAKKYSIDKVSAAKGGDLGFFGRRQYVEEFENAAFNLKNIGDVSGVVKTPLGFHIIKLTGIKHLKPQKLEDAGTEIKQVLQKEKLDKWIDDTSKQYKIKINYELLANPVGPTESR